jgi:hypothetical protein
MAGFQSGELVFIRVNPCPSVVEIISRGIVQDEFLAEATSLADGQDALLTGV